VELNTHVAVSSLQNPAYQDAPDLQLAGDLGVAFQCRIAFEFRQQGAPPSPVGLVASATRNQHRDASWVAGQQPFQILFSETHLFLPAFEGLCFAVP
jgi:hypothetical protein